MSRVEVFLTGVLTGSVILCIIGLFTANDDLLLGAAIAAVLSCVFLFVAPNADEEY